MHLGNTRLNIVKWASFRQDDSDPLICSCDCNQGDHTVYDPTEITQEVTGVPLLTMWGRLVQTGISPSKPEHTVNLTKISPSIVSKTSQTKESFG